MKSNFTSREESAKKISAKSLPLIDIEGINDNLFLNSSEEDVETFFARLQKLPSPQKENTFVLCCLARSLSLEAIQQ